MADSVWEKKIYFFHIQAINFRLDTNKFLIGDNFTCENKQRMKIWESKIILILCNPYSISWIFPKNMKDKKRL